MLLIFPVGTGTGGSTCDTDSESFPSVPYSNYDFNDGNCNSASGNIENYNDPNEVIFCVICSAKNTIRKTYMKNQAKQLKKMKYFLSMLVDVYFLHRETI